MRGKPKRVLKTFWIYLRSPSLSDQSNIGTATQTFTIGFFPLTSGTTISWNGSCSSWQTWTRTRVCWSCSSWRSWSTSSNPMKHTGRRSCQKWRRANSGSSGTHSSPTRTSWGTCDPCTYRMYTPGSCSTTPPCGFYSLGAVTVSFQIVIDSKLPLYQTHLCLHLIQIYQPGS